MRIIMECSDFSEFQALDASKKLQKNELKMIVFIVLEFIETRPFLESGSNTNRNAQNGIQENPRPKVLQNIKKNPKQPLFFRSKNLEEPILTYYFEEALKNMRRVDDLIISTINTAIPTDSFKANPTEACKDLYQQLERGNIERENKIKNCINVTTANVKVFKDRREANESDNHLSKALRSEQTKLRMLQMELTVEELIWQRTTKVFNERCRRYFKVE